MRLKKQKRMQPIAEIISLRMKKRISAMVCVYNMVKLANEANINLNGRKKKTVDLVRSEQCCNLFEFELSDRENGLFFQVLVYGSV